MNSRIICRTTHTTYYYDNDKVCHTHSIDDSLSNDIDGGGLISLVKILLHLVDILTHTIIET